MLGLLAKNFFSDSPVLFFPVFALLLFIAVFTAISIATLRRNKRELDEIAMTPLAADVAPGDETHACQ